MAAPPTFVGDHSATSSTNWSTTTTPKTATFTPGNGNILALLGAMEATTVALTLSGTPTMTQQQINNTGSNCTDAGWTATGAGSSVTPSLARGASTLNFGFDCLEFSGSAGVGASNKATSQTGTHTTLGLTTQQDNSAIVAIWAEFNAVPITGRTWDAVNGFTPDPAGILNQYERAAIQVASAYSVFVAYWPDAGTAGAKTVGLTTGVSSQTSAIVAIEIKGSTAIAALPEVTMAPRIPT